MNLDQSAGADTNLAAGAPPQAGINGGEIKVLFVCLANICRSPMAQAVFTARVKAAGLEQAIIADSAATAHYRLGEPPHRKIRDLLAARGIALPEHKARLLQTADLQSAHYVLAMDDENLRSIAYFGRRAGRLEPLAIYAPQSGKREVPDPLKTGNFEEVYTMIEEASKNLLAAIRRERSL